MPLFWHPDARQAGPHRSGHSSGKRGLHDLARLLDDGLPRLNGWLFNGLLAVLRCRQALGGRFATFTHRTRQR